MADEFMTAGGVVIALCMPEQYITIVWEEEDNGFELIRTIRYCMVSSNKRKATIFMETWQFFRKEMRLRINIYPQQKTNDYGRAPTAQEIEYATYCDYRALCQTLTDSLDPLEQHGEADMAEVARQEAEG
ncbi:hypothetical protein L7F22_011927 [Adiantum nelumboides]|nr:hypothetical protein [Adiantum nelumboides]